METHEVRDSMADATDNIPRSPGCGTIVHQHYGLSTGVDIVCRHLGKEAEVAVRKLVEDMSFLASHMTFAFGSMRRHRML